MKHERDVAYLFQRAPEPVPTGGSPNSGRPASVAHWSGAIGSITIFVPIGMLLLHPVARDLTRVVAGEHEVVVDAEHERLQQRQRGERGDSTRGRQRSASATIAHAADIARIGYIGSIQRAKKRELLPK